MVTRDFDAMLSESHGVRPTFRLAGQTFTLKARLPNKKFKAFLAQLGAEDADEQEQEDAFFRMCLIPQDRERFFALFDNDGEGEGQDEFTVVAPQQVSELTTWLLELYTGKQSPSSESSSAGSASTGGSLNVVSLSSRSQPA